MVYALTIGMYELLKAFTNDQRRIVKQHTGMYKFLLVCANIRLNVSKIMPFHSMSCFRRRLLKSTLKSGETYMNDV